MSLRFYLLHTVRGSFGLPNDKSKLQRLFLLFLIICICLDEVGLDERELHFKGDGRSTQFSLSTTSFSLIFPTFVNVQGSLCLKRGDSHYCWHRRWQNIIRRRRQSAVSTCLVALAASCFVPKSLTIGDVVSNFKLKQRYVYSRCQATVVKSDCPKIVLHHWAW